MGMFDTIYVEKRVVCLLLQDHPEILKGIHQSQNEYFYFQTKSLERSLSEYFLKNKRLYIVPWTYEKPTLEKSTKIQRVIKLPGQFCENLTKEIIFYDSVKTKDESIFVNFALTIVNGIQTNIIVLSIDRSNILDLKQQQQKRDLRFKQIQSTWEWKLFCLVDKFTSRMKKFLNLNNLKEWLINRAKLKYPE